MLWRGLGILAKKELANKENTETQEKTGGLDLTKLTNETKEELAKIVWPSRQQLISESAAVMLMVALVATVIYLVDKLFAFGAGVVFK
jgi:preprotein translocase subunit SecE